MKHVLRLESKIVFRYLRTLTGRSHIGDQDRVLVVYVFTALTLKPFLRRADSDSCSLLDFTKQSLVVPPDVQPEAAYEDDQDDAYDDRHRPDH